MTDPIDAAAPDSDVPGATETGDVVPAPGARTAEDARTELPPVHRLRALTPRGRWAAVVLGVLLVLVPLIAAGVNHGRWEPQGDDTLIELRARDVFTDRNPLVGQPSTSGTYGAKAENVAHPGPLGFVVLAPTGRLLGPVTGTLVAAAAVSAVSMLAVAWLLFRRLGPRGGAAGSALVALAAFSAGAAGLIDPLSSNFGRMALLAASVGVWALLCGDLRTAPLTAAFWTFAAQQHLSVLPAAAVLGGVGVLAVAFWIWRLRGAGRRQALAWAGGAVAVGLVLWAPVLYQEVTSDPGNLTALSHYSGDAQREDLGPRSSLNQLANALGPRPFLGRSSPKGWELVSHRSTPGIAVTLLLVGAVLAVGSWWRRKEPAFLAAVAMIGVLSVAGLVTGANIPNSPEQGRLNFYHWAFALSFFVLLAGGWLLARLAPVVTPKLTHGRPVTAVAASAVIVAGVAFTPLVVTRASDRLGQPLAPAVVAEVISQLESPGAVAKAGGPMLVLVNGDDRFIQAGDTFGARLGVDGWPVVFPPSSKGFVHPARIADPCTVPRALVISLIRGDIAEPPGTKVASADAAPALDRAALERLTEQAQGVPVEFGPEFEAALDALPGDQGDLIGSTISFRLGFRPEEVLLVRYDVDLLIDHPLAAPVLDRGDLIALRDSLPTDVGALQAKEVTAHLLDRAQLEQFRPDLFEGC